MTFEGDNDSDQMELDDDGAEQGDDQGSGPGGEHEEEEEGEQEEDEEGKQEGEHGGWEEEEEGEQGENGGWEEDGDGDSTAFAIGGDADVPNESTSSEEGDADHSSGEEDQPDQEEEEDDQEPDAPVRAVSASSCQLAALSVIQHADTGLSHLDALFAPLVSLSPSPSASTMGFFSRVAVLNVRGNALRDLAPLALLAPSLRVLNAAANALASLPPRPFWVAFARLELCFLADNALAAWADGKQADDWLDALTGASALRWLTLAGNPVMARPRARTAVVNKLRQLCALDDLVVADSERVQFARATPRYPLGDDDARRLRMEPPRVFADDAQALRFVELARCEVVARHARNSACVAIQRVLRGFLSRNYRRRRGRICGMWTLRKIVTRVQAAARGFLLRRRLEHEFEALVVAQGEEALLDLDPSQSLRVPLSARRALQRLRALVQRWRRHLRDKKHAVAVTKIRVWCRMVRQRHRRRAEQLVRDRQELIVYFEDDGHGKNEERVLALASWAARRDPFLMQLPVSERDQFLRARCSVPSGVRVLRGVMYSTPLSSALRTAGALDPSHVYGDTSEALVRVFPSDMARETQVLVAQKRLLQSDLERVRSALEAANRPDPMPIALGSSALTRGVAVHLKQMERELEARLAVCSKKVLAACVKAQAWKQRAATRKCSLVKKTTALRPRGFALSRWERRQLSGKCRPSSSGHSRVDGRSARYRALQAFIPWSVDMYLLVLAGLASQPPQLAPSGTASSRRQSRAPTPVNNARKVEFLALSYEQTRRVSAALAVQSAWRATRVYSKRLALEATIARARLCLQRWWRQRAGLRRRLAFLRACVLVGASVNSRTLYMEARVFHALRDRARWDKVQGALFRRWPEHALLCRINSRGRAVIAVPTPALLALRSASQEGVSLAQVLSSQALSAATGTMTSAKAVAAQAAALAAQRCSSGLPAWLPGVPEHEEATMSSRSGDDATSQLLSEGVHVEATLLERELMLHGRQGAIADVFAQSNPFRCMATGHRVAEAGTQLMALAHQLSSLHMPANRGDSPSRREAASTLLVLETTSLVRLQFDSVDEARRRALLLLAKTFDPVTTTFAQLHSLEALVGAALRHHQWALSQLPNAEEALATLDCAQRWLSTHFPSPWWTSVERRLLQLGMSAAAVAELSSPPTPSPPVSRPLADRHAATATSPTESSIAACYRDAHGRRSALRRAKALEGAADATLAEADGPMRVVVNVTSLGQQPETLVAARRLPQPPAPPASPSLLSSPAVRAPVGGQTTSNESPLGSGRHELLANRLGPSKPFESIAELRQEQLEQRMYHVRDLREGRERAMEALIVDRRMQLRERAAEVAGVKLDIDVKLVKRRYERELGRLSARESIESDELAAKRSKLTREFERQFVAQSGALMRRAARAAVAQSRQAQHEAQQQRAREMRERDAEELDRRQDAKSWWFVNNQRVRRECGAQQRADAVDVAASERVRLLKARQRIQEDKEIKNLLRIM